MMFTHLLRVDEKLQNIGRKTCFPCRMFECVWFGINMFKIGFC